jgi:hypothetical protein
LEWPYTLISRIRNVAGFDMRRSSIKKQKGMAAAQGFAGEFWLRDRPDVREPVQRYALTRTLICALSSRAGCYSLPT